MCGRFVLSTDIKKFKHFFALPENDFPDWKPSYNIAPSDNVAGVFDRCNLLHGVYFKWGLVPHWAKDPKIGHKMINARSETLTEKPAFKKYFKHQRCLILADGFYEWKITNNRKIPYFIHRKDNVPLAFAGLWSDWEEPDGKLIYTCTIITGPPNELVARLHDRMPVILSSTKYDEWLDQENNNTSSLQKLLKPFPEEEMEIYPVSSFVNSPLNDDPGCIKRVSEINCRS